MPLSYCNCEFKLLILPPFYFCPLVFFYTVRVWVLYDQRENERKAGVFLVFSPFGVFFFSLDPKKKKKKLPDVLFQANSSVIHPQIHKLHLI